MKGLNGKKNRFLFLGIGTIILLFYVITNCFIVSTNKTIIKAEGIENAKALDKALYAEFYRNGNAITKINDSIDNYPSSQLSNYNYTLTFKVKSNSLVNTYDPNRLHVEFGNRGVLEEAIVNKPVNIDDEGFIALKIKDAGYDFIRIDYDFVTIGRSDIGLVEFNIEQPISPKLAFSDKTKNTFYKGSTHSFKYLAQDIDNNSIRATSSNVDVASVNLNKENGTVSVKGLKKGEATISIFGNGTDGNGHSDVVKIYIIDASGQYSEPHYTTDSSSDDPSSDDPSYDTPVVSAILSPEDFDVYPGEINTIYLENVNYWDYLKSCNEDVIETASFSYNENGNTNISFYAKEDITQNTWTQIKIDGWGNGGPQNGEYYWMVNVWADPILDTNVIKLKPGQEYDYKVNNSTYYGYEWDQSGTNGCVTVTDYYSESDMCWHLKVKANFEGTAQMNFTKFGNPRWYNNGTWCVPIVIEDDKPITSTINYVDTQENSYTNKEKSKFKIIFSEEVNFTTNDVDIQGADSYEIYPNGSSGKEYILEIKNPVVTNGTIGFFIKPINNNNVQGRASEKFEYYVDRVKPVIKNFEVTTNSNVSGVIGKDTQVTVKFDVEDENLNTNAGTPSFQNDWQVLVNGNIVGDVDSTVNKTVNNSNNKVINYEIKLNKLGEYVSKYCSEKSGAFDFKLLVNAYTSFGKDKAGNKISEFTYSQQTGYTSLNVNATKPKVTEFNAKLNNSKDKVEMTFTITDDEEMADPQSENIIMDGYAFVDTTIDNQTIEKNAGATSVTKISSSSKELKYKIVYPYDYAGNEKLKFYLKNGSNYTLYPHFADNVGNTVENYSVILTKDDLDVDSGYGNGEISNVLELEEFKFICDNSPSQVDYNYHIFKNKVSSATSGFTFTFSNTLKTDDLHVNVKVKPYENSTMTENMVLSVNKVYDDTTYGKHNMVYMIPYSDNKAKIDKIDRGIVEVTLSGIKAQEGNETLEDITMSYGTDSHGLIYDLRSPTSDVTKPTVKVTAYKYDSTKSKYKGDKVKDTITFTDDGEYVINNANWVNYGITFDFTSSDNDELDSATWSFNDTKQYSDTGNTWKEENNPAPLEGIRTLTGEGWRKAKYTVTDKSGNETTITVVVKIDKTAPTVNITSYKYDSTKTNNLGSSIKTKQVYASDGSYVLSDDWLNYPVAFKVEAIEATGSVSGTWKWETSGNYNEPSDSTQYNGGTHNVDGLVFYDSFTGDGWRKAIYEVSDEAGNKRKIKVFAKIDTTAPEIKVTTGTYDSSKANYYTEPVLKARQTVNGNEYIVSEDWLNHAVAFKIEATDNHELKSGEWKWNVTNSAIDTGNTYNGGKQTIAKANCSTFYQKFSGDGYRKAQYTMQDTAGNKKVITFIAKLDQTAPKIESENIVSEPEKNDTWRKNQKVTITGVTELQGEDNVTLKYAWAKNGIDDVNGITFKNGAINQPITLNNANGVYDLYVRLSDNLGNEKTYKVGTYNLDNILSGTEMGRAKIEANGNNLIAWIPSHFSSGYYAGGISITEVDGITTYNCPYTSDNIDISLLPGGQADGESGSKETTYKILKKVDGEFVVVGDKTTMPSTLYDNGEYIVEVTTVDNAGNSKTERYILHKGQANISFTPNGGKGVKASTAVKLTDTQNAYETVSYAWVKEGEEAPNKDSDEGWTTEADADAYKSDDGVTIEKSTKENQKYNLYVRTETLLGVTNVVKSKVFTICGKIERPGTIEFKENNGDGKVITPQNKTIKTKENVWMKITAGSDSEGTVRTYYKILRNNQTVVGNSTVESTTLNEEGLYKLTLTSERVGDYPLKEETTYTIYVDKTVPNIKFTKVTEDGANTGKIKVEIDDNGNAENSEISNPAQTGINNDNLRYYWTSGGHAPSKNEFFEAEDNYRGKITSLTQNISTPEGVSGIWVLWVYAEDNVGQYTISQNRTSGDNDTVVDNEAPIAGTIDMFTIEETNEETKEIYSNDTFTNKNVKLELKAGYDANTGISSNTYKIVKDGNASNTFKAIWNGANGAEEHTIDGLRDYTTDMILTDTGVYTITVTTKDNATTPHTATNTYKVKIDKVAPIITANPEYDTEYAKQHKVTMNITEPETESGVKYNKTKFVWVGFDITKFNGEDTVFNDDVEGLINEQFELTGTGETGTGTRTVDFVTKVFQDSAKEKIEKLNEKGIFIVPVKSIDVTENTEVPTPDGLTGRFHLLTYAEDNVGNSKVQYTRRFNLDNTPPTKPDLIGGKKEIVGTQEKEVVYISELTNSDVKVIAMNSKSLSGVDKYEVSYTTDDGKTWSAWKDATTTKEINGKETTIGQITIKKEGKTIVKYRGVSELKDGRLEGEESDEFTVLIDKTGPEVAFENTENGKNGSNVSVESIKVRTTVTDNAGVNTNSLKYNWIKFQTTQDYNKVKDLDISSKKSMMKLDEAKTFSNGEPIPSSSDLEGIYALFVYAKDNIGNESIRYSNFYVFNKANQEEESPYELERSYIKRVIPETTTQDFVKNVKPLVVGEEYVVKDKQGNVIYTVKGNNAQGDATKLVTTDGKVVIDGKEYTIVVIADLNGDGRLNGIDIARMRLSRVDKIKLTGAYEKAADINNDGKLDGRDLIRMRLLNIGLANFTE